MLTITWQGDQFQTVKTFGARSCQLCTLEKVAIVLETQGNSVHVINSWLDVGGACPHHLKFHRFSFVPALMRIFIQKRSLIPLLYLLCQFHVSLNLQKWMIFKAWPVLSSFLSRLVLVPI
jgi:hypothetical protein